MQLVVQQSKRSLKPLLRWQEEQQRRQAGAAQRAARPAPQRQEGARSPHDLDGRGLEVTCEDGSVAPLQAPVRRIKKLYICHGPPSRMVWVGNVGGHATAADVTALFSRRAAGSGLAGGLGSASGLGRSQT